MKIGKVRTFFFGVLSAAALGTLVSTGAQAEGFTAEQAANGKATFEQNCQRCHAADLTGAGPFPPLTGDGFMGRWGGRTAGDLFNFISRRMPRDRPGQLAKEDYVKIVAFWLSFHGHTPGNETLTESAGIVLRP